jgi:DNA-directed RNA polymerase subunit RPC12/RpoP
MGIFNKNVFDELENGLKNLSEKIKRNIDNDDKEKHAILKCPNCGAVLEQNNQDEFIKCPYCASQIKNQNYSKSWFED